MVARIAALVHLEKRTTILLFRNLEQWKHLVNFKLIEFRCVDTDGGAYLHQVWNLYTHINAFIFTFSLCPVITRRCKEIHRAKTIQYSIL